MKRLGTILVLAVSMLCAGPILFSQDVSLTNEGKIPGQPFACLQQQIDQL